jgi:DNA-binding response OmpR family regulator
MDLHDATINVLLIEDDARLARFTAIYLQEHGLCVSISEDGETGLLEARNGSFDVIVLDLMLPGRDGFSVCSALRRESDVPILVLTAKSDEEDRVFGLDVGADDYLVKPFSPRELLARIRANVRRARGLLSTRSEVVSAGRLVLHTGTRSATLDGRDLNLTDYEFALLRALAVHRGRPLSREHLMELAKGSAEESFDRSIDVRVSRLRAKLGDDPKRPHLLRTVRGQGYMLAFDSEAVA